MIHHIKTDLKRFKNITTETKIHDKQNAYSNFDSAINHLQSCDDVESIYIIGGSEIYKYALQYIVIDRIFVTYIHSKSCIQNAIYFPFHYLRHYHAVCESEKYTGNGVYFQFLEYRLKDGVLEE